MLNETMCMWVCGCVLIVCCVVYPEKYNTVYKSNFVPYKHKNYVHQSSTDPMLVCYVRKPGYDDEYVVCVGVIALFV